MNLHMKQFLFFDIQPVDLLGRIRVGLIRGPSDGRGTGRTYSIVLTLVVGRRHLFSNSLVHTDLYGAEEAVVGYHGSRTCGVRERGGASSQTDPTVSQTCRTMG